MQSAFCQEKDLVEQKTVRQKTAIRDRGASGRFSARQDVTTQLLVTKLRLRHGHEREAPASIGGCEAGAPRDTYSQHSSETIMIGEQ